MGDVAALQGLVLSTRIDAVILSTVDDNMKEVEQVMAVAESPDLADGLRAASLLRGLAEQIEIRHVAAARQAGWYWQEIGDAKGPLWFERRVRAHADEGLCGRRALGCPDSAR